MTSRHSCIATSVLRFYICGLAVFAWFMAFHESRSMNAIAATFPEGAAVYWMMFLCGMVGIVDVIVNDCTAKPSWHALRTNRHFGFLALAFAYAYLAFLAVLKVASPSLAFYALWNAVFIIGFALLDAHQRSALLVKEAARHVCRKPA
jgi:hypothetical protein